MAVPVTSSDSATPDAGAASAADQLAAMTAELQERDQLIEVLTERLEEAAEQLDRVHRSGGDRAVRGGGGGPAGGGLPGEVVDRLLEVADRTEVMAAEWEEVQGGSLLHRMDARLEKLIEIIRGDELADPPPPAAQSPIAAYYEQQGGEEQAGESPVTAAMPEAADEPEPPIELADAPQEIDDAEADSERLHEGLRERDEYIAYLIRELRRRRPRQPIDWEALKDCPEELAERLKALETRLQSELQREELALSLERAKLARERGELDKIRSRLEREIRGMGSKSASKEEDAGKQGEVSASRLARLFGGAGK